MPDTTKLKDQLNAFLRRKTHFALVVDEYGEVEGLVTLEDIIEEIVGDIADEHDVDIQGVRQEADGSVVVDGTVPIRDLNRVLDWNLPDDEATTIAGLVIHETQSIPEEKQAFTFHGKRFIVHEPRQEPPGADPHPPGRAGVSLPARRLAGRRRFDRQRMDPARELGGKQRIDQAVALQPALAGEGGRDDADAEMGLARCRHRRRGGRMPHDGGRHGDGSR